MTVKGRKGPEEFKVDEHPKPDSTIEQLAKLAPVFKKDGTITAANASVSYFHCTFVFVYIYMCVVFHWNKKTVLIILLFLGNILCGKIRYHDCSYPGIRC